MTVCEKRQKGLDVTFEESINDDMDFLNSGHDVEWEKGTDYTFPVCKKCGIGSITHGHFKCIISNLLK